MRCLNCGWDNNPNDHKCLKCGQLLSKGISRTENDSEPTDLKGNESRPTVLSANTNKLEPKPTVIFSSPNNGSDQSAPDKRATVIFQSGAPSANEGTSENSSSTIIIECPFCGYPASQGVCPNCGKNKNRNTVMQTRGRNVPVAAGCSLTIIPEYNESFEPKRLEYQGEQITLNRSNTEPANLSITSKIQAELTYEDGKWFISDKSEYETTYIQVQGKMELKPGDIILLGDRRFKFE